ncbi:hypothetical protein B296_00009148 [Ensete ventricosum]|uniref:Uncharacterized protein n=1 Tax=Ensete ventricosum TaxID=4639 RepID=A0A426XHL5_ENSVE|nr:hypothetical protein B296_00009148 [Ensete ventricosum]
MVAKGRSRWQRQQAMGRRRVIAEVAAKKSTKQWPTGMKAAATAAAVGEKGKSSMAVLKGIDGASQSSDQV